MKIITHHSTVQPLVSLVCCVHGDEVFGLEVFEYYKKHANQFPGLQVILANEEALKKGVRYTDVDLNRICPGTKDGKGEQGLAYELVELLKSSKYILDIHTTVSDMKLVPIVTKMTEDVKTILGQIHVEHIAYMQPSITTQSLIGQFAGAVSLEFGHEYAKTFTARQCVQGTVQRLLKNEKYTKTERTIFVVDQIIPKESVLPSNTGNLRYSKELGGYPFLLHEKAYKDIRGFLASKRETVFL